MQNNAFAFGGNNSIVVFSGDPRRFSLLAFGGAGPLHAAAVARVLGIPKVIVPQYPGVFSALA